MAEARPSPAKLAEKLLARSRTDNVHYSRRKGIHKHKAPSKQRFLAEIVEDIWPFRRYQHLVSGDGSLVIGVDFHPVRQNEIVQDYGCDIVIVSNEDISIIHASGIHIRMGVEHGMQRVKCMLASYLV